MIGARGYVAHVGASRLDSTAPIVVIVTLESNNDKTGQMAQAWVIRADVAPHLAIRDGRDDAICGDCVHRSGTRLERSCYVVVHFSPLNVWRAYTSGRYPDLAGAAAARALAGAQLRVTAYGDPAAVPFELWCELLTHVAGFTFYTHQWRTCDQRFQQLAMASVESEAEAEYAHALGWRTFRTRLTHEEVRADEIVCPASNEAGHRVTCDRCGLCRGQMRAGARSIAILAHGQRIRWFADRKSAVAFRSSP